MHHPATLLKSASHGHFTEKQSKELRVLSHKSIGTNDSTLSIQITQSIEQIELPDSQLNKNEAEMTDIMKFNDSVIMTIPGIGYIKRIFHLILILLFIASSPSLSHFHHVFTLFLFPENPIKISYPIIPRFHSVIPYFYPSYICLLV